MKTDEGFSIHYVYKHIHIFSGRNIKNKTEHAVQSYAAGIGGKGARGPGTMGYIYNVLSKCNSYIELHYPLE